MMTLNIGDTVIRDHFDDHARPFVVCSIEPGEGDQVIYGLVRAGDTSVLKITSKELEYGEWALKIEGGLANVLSLKDLLLADWRVMTEQDFFAWADAASDSIVTDVQGRDGRMWQVIFGTGCHDSDDRTPSFEGTSGGVTAIRLEIGDVKFERF